ncbi:hypothetical protein CEV31_3712 [Brucella thiophenivorans]|uniref:Uncharacterized protein n=1 Tax=Brucella thiophenivorans TaxID=571255 RepID=A0A256FA06_9HYPH|nr:hypothetical protein CEV31_3712 [Brucella thiophenivorans]
MRKKVIALKNDPNVKMQLVQELAVKFGAERVRTNFDLSAVDGFKAVDATQSRAFSRPAPPD